MVGSDLYSITVKSHVTLLSRRWIKILRRVAEQLHFLLRTLDAFDRRKPGVCSGPELLTLQSHERFQCFTQFVDIRSSNNS